MTDLFYFIALKIKGVLIKHSVQYSALLKTLHSLGDLPSQTPCQLRAVTLQLMHEDSF